MATAVATPGIPFHPEAHPQRRAFDSLSYTSLTAVRTTSAAPFARSLDIHGTAEDNEVTTLRSDPALR